VPNLSCIKRIFKVELVLVGVRATARYDSLYSSLALNINVYMLNLISAMLPFRNISRLWNKMILPVQLKIRQHNGSDSVTKSINCLLRSDECLIYVQNVNSGL
jgi:hypothetical protein